ncbi:DoxX family protein [Xanthobacter dioxanivorans]|uniref:DoxX family protein n=1 Tax=Xanthobacter dioxanivorans TaxID=2528964 RepID=A0A974SK21_9HYPH|nr:DoxX family protein [Xanthobacter dioxanivorans]QRG08032.1 DoxX family protein [Xanthobacter dioxanivorans]
MRVLDDLALLVGRFCAAALFLPAGISKMGKIAGFAGSLAAKGIPFPTLMAYLTVVVEVGGGLLLILGLFPRITAVVLAGFVVIATATSHVFWILPDPAAQAAQQIHFFKNVGIIGGLLFYFASGAGAFALGRKAAAV